MSFKDLVQKGVAGVCDLALGKMTVWLDDYKKAIAVLEKFGFTVEKFTLDMAVPPQIHTVINGKIEDIRVAELKQMIAEHQEETLLVSILQALILTRQVWEHVELRMTSITIMVSLGLSPKIHVEIH